MINNGEVHYDHDKDGYTNEFSGWEAQFRSKKYDTFISIRYQNFTLTVRFVLCDLLLFPTYKKFAYIINVGFD